MHTDTNTDTQTHTHTHRQTDRQTDRHTHTHTHTHTLLCPGSNRYNYQYAFAHQRYPLEFANGSTNMFLWPQVYCEYADATKPAHGSTWCVPHPSGAVFKGNATLHIRTCNDAYDVVYTTDGSPPTPTSPVAKGPISINATTTVRAQLKRQRDLAPGNPTAVMTFTRWDA